MPSGMAAAVREAVGKENKEGLQLERSPWSKTGFKNVIEIKGKYQARLQVPGDGRGGTNKRKQHALPGLFDTAEDAAAALAMAKRDMLAAYDGKVIAPPKQNKPHKPRNKLARPTMASPVPLQQPQLLLAATVAVPLPFPIPNVPFAAALPLPMQPLCGFES